MDVEYEPSPQRRRNDILQHRPCLKRVGCCCVVTEVFCVLVFAGAAISLAVAGIHSQIFQHHPGEINNGSQVFDNFDIVRGVNLGGWLVLEPWIVPSLFFQFHGWEKPAIDEKTFCEVLGEVEARRQLNEFRDTWVTEETFVKLARIGLNAVRIPYGYWIYGDRPEFCTNISAIEYLDRAVEWAGKYGLRVHLDLHGTMRSANGQDNSGEMFRGKYADRWHSGSSFDADAWAEGEALNATVSVMARVVKRYENQSHVVMFGLVNEPLFVKVGGCSSARGCPFSPEELNEYYKIAYKKVRAAVGKEAAVRLSPVLDMNFRTHSWSFTRNDFWQSSSNWGALGDVHHYFAFWPASAWLPQAHFLRYSACNWQDDIGWMHEHTLPTMVGEWSLAVTDCQGWLSAGYGNDMIFSSWGGTKCGHVPCPSTYGRLPDGATIEGNNGAPAGECPVDPPKPPWGPLDREEFYKTLALYQMRGYERSLGWFFWNFQCEVDDPSWCFLNAYDRGWFPKNLSTAAYAPPEVPHCGSWDTPFGATINAFLVALASLIGLLAVPVLACVVACGTWGWARAKGEPFLRPSPDAEQEPGAGGFSLQRLLPASWRTPVSTRGTEPSAPILG